MITPSEYVVATMATITVVITAIVANIKTSVDQPTTVPVPVVMEMSPIETVIETPTDPETNAARLDQLEKDGETINVEQQQLVNKVKELTKELKEGK